MFPLSYNNKDSEDVIDALNYVLSGPSGLGQNFAGVSGYNVTSLTGNGRPPQVIASVSVNALGAAGTFTVQVDSVEGIREGNYVSNPGPTIGVGAQVAVGGINADTKTITLTVANITTVSGLVTFSEALRANMYVAPIAVTSIVWINSFTVRINYAAQPSPPFELGNNPRVSGNSLSIYNYFYSGAGVISCTTTYAIVRNNRSIANPGTGLGGTVTFSSTLPAPASGNVPPPNDWIRTDCNANSSVTGATDRVFISAQIDQRVGYVAAAVSDLRVTVAINRYRIVNIGDPANPELRNVFDLTVAQRSNLYSGLIGTGELPTYGTVFNTFIDEPEPGYYQYRLEVLYRVVNTAGSMQVTYTEVDVRTLSTQVVKQ